MQKNTKRAVIITNPSSPYISEAIIFLKENMSIKEEKIIIEAEKIIDEYIRGSQFMSDIDYGKRDDDISLYKKGTIKKAKKTHRRHMAVILSIVTAVFALCVYSIFYNISR